MYHTDLNISLDDIQKETNIKKLLKWRSQIDRDIANIKIQKTKAVLEYQKTGIKKDTEWFSKLISKKYIYGHLSSAIQLRVGELKDSSHFYREFFEVVKEQLGEKMVDNFINIVNQKK